MTMDGLPEKAAFNTPDIRQTKTGPPGWARAWVNFTQDTTFHGLRYIWMEGAFILRRLVWLLVVMGCACVMGYQIIDRIIYYYNYPVTVNVHVNFNTSLAFPSVTLCNQNAFRATAATSQKRYRLIEEMFTKADNFNISVLDVYNASGVTLDELYSSAAHRKEDLIISCKWQGETCGPDNFTEVFTDHGVCYSFNSKKQSLLRVSSTGSDYGLKLTLNVEQYEYMPGPHDAAGAKLLLHDHKQFPKVHELGLAIPTGSHTFIGIQLVSVENLEKPHGNCGSRTSQYYTIYSTDSCQMQCAMEYMVAACGCRHHYMAHIGGQPPICTLDQFYSCYTKIISKVKDRVRLECKCPIPCNFLIFDPTISFASTSMYASERLLATTNLDDLRRKYSNARETTSVMDRVKFNKFLHFEKDVVEKLARLKNIMFTEVQAKLLDQEKTIERIFNETHAAWKKKDYLYKYQAYTIKKNFIRPRNAMEERTFNYLALGFQEYSYQIETKIKQLAGDSLNSSDVRLTIYTLTTNELDGKIDLAYRAFDNYTQLFTAYKNGSPIFRYKYLREPRKDNPYIAPKFLFTESLNYSAYARKYSYRVGSDIMKYKDALLDYRDLAKEAYFNHTLNATKLYLANVNFLWRGRRYYHSKSSFYAFTIEYPLQIVEERIQTLNNLHEQFCSNIKYMEDNLKNILSELTSLEKTILKKLDFTLLLTKMYVKYRNVTKMDVALELTSPEINKGISAITVFFQNLRSRGQKVYDSWEQIIKSSANIWDVAINDKDMVNYFQYKNLTMFLQNFTEVKFYIEQNYTAYRDSYDLRFLVGNADSALTDSLEGFIQLMSKYVATSKVDNTFISENFLQLDIFYRERSYEQITQQVAYDIFGLLCDIGGSMGLFVGASVLSVFELFDLVAHQSIYRVTHAQM